MEKSNWDIRELFKRTISVILLVPIVLLLVNLKGTFFVILLVIAAILMAYEWVDVTKNAKCNICWKLFGLAYIVIPSVSLFEIINLPNGEKIIYFLFVLVWLSDIGGYLFGKMIGGYKLAPEISPNKTWAGFFGGIFLAIIGASFFQILPIFYIIILSIVAQLGDLFESKIKRVFNIKDSGNLIPGHGGILDAVDGLITTAPILLLILTIKF